MARIVTFGEIMGRLAPPTARRFRQALPGTLEMSFAGAEANVAVSICCLGGEATFVTALPGHAVADACVATLRGLGVDTRYVLRTEQGRLGLYYVETGANQRPGTVIYDRAGAAVAETSSHEYNLAGALEGADWFHVTGITPALSRVAADATLDAVRQARQLGVRVSCDLNFRKKLWRWDASIAPRDLAGATMRRILPLVDMVIGNEEDAADVLSIEASETDVDAGRLAIDRYPDVARRIVSEFPNLARVAITLRESISASHNNWGAMLYESATDTPHFAPLREGGYRPYEIRNIVDRVGGGDAFAAGLLFALTTPELNDSPRAISFAVAASCLAHSVPGHFNYSSRQEVEALMKGSGAGRVIR
ncbi:MAG: PfkB family carbohydrate kinase [Pirellulales bacterium]